MKRFRVLVFIVGLLIVYASILWIPAASISAVYQSQRANCNYNLINGILRNCIVKDKITFYFSCDNILFICTLICGLIATLFVSLKRGRWIGICFYIATIILLSFNVNVAVVAQSLQNESYEIHEKISPFLLIDFFLFAIIYFIQTIMIKREVVITS